MTNIKVLDPITNGYGTPEKPVNIWSGPLAKDNLDDCRSRNHKSSQTEMNDENLKQVSNWAGNAESYGGVNEDSHSHHDANDESVASSHEDHVPKDSASSTGDSS